MSRLLKGLKSLEGLTLLDIRRHYAEDSLYVLTAEGAFSIQPGKGSHVEGVFKSNRSVMGKSIRLVMLSEGASGPVRRVQKATLRVSTGEYLVVTLLGDPNATGDLADFDSAVYDSKPGWSFLWGNAV